MAAAGERASSGSTDTLDDCLLQYAATLWQPHWSVAATEHSDHRGFLSKQSKSTPVATVAGVFISTCVAYRKRWTRRWFVCVKDVLFYFQKGAVASALPLGVLFLDHATVIQNVSAESAVPWCFSIAVASSCSLESGKSYANRTYFLAAGDIGEFNGWMSALQHACGHGRHPPDSETHEYPALPPPLVLSPDGELLASSPTTRLIVEPLSGSNSTTLSSLLLETFRCISDLRAILQPSPAAANTDTSVSLSPINFTDPATKVVRKVRQLLYIVDSSVIKRIRLDEFQECLRRYLSLMVEWCRKIGQRAKAMTEDGCLGYATTKSAQELVICLDDMSVELQLFINLAKNILETNTIAAESLASMSDGTVVSSFRKQVLDHCTEFLRLLSHRSGTLLYMANCEELVIFARALSSIGFETVPEDRLDSRALLIQLESRHKELSNHLKETAASCKSPQSELPLVDCVFALALLLVRIPAVLEGEAEEKRSGFLQRLGTEITTQRAIFVASERRKASFDLGEILTLVGDASPRLRPVPPSPAFSSLSMESNLLLDMIPPLSSLPPHISSDVLSHSLPNTYPRHPSLSQSARAIDIGPFRQSDRAFLKLAPPPPPPLYPSRPFKSFSFGSRSSISAGTRFAPQRSFYQCLENSADQLHHAFAVNTAIVASVSELQNLIGASTKSLFSNLNPTELSRARTDTIELAVQTATCIVTAACQLTEEANSLECGSSSDEIIRTLESAHDSVIHALASFENSVKNLTKIFSASDSWKDVLIDARQLEVFCGRMVEAINFLVRHQASILHSRAELSPPLVIEGVCRDGKSASSPRACALSCPSHRRKSDPSCQKKEELLEKEEVERAKFKDLVVRPHSEEAGSSVVKGGTLEALVHKLTHHKLPSADFTSAFLLTYRSFTTPSELLRLLLERYTITVPRELTPEQINAYVSQKVVPIRLRVMNVLKTWIKHYYEDFEECPALLQTLREFLPTMKADFHKGTADFQAVLERKAKGEPNYQKQTNVPPPPPILPKKLQQFALLDVDPFELARQITLLQWRMYISIKPKECLQQCWNKCGEPVGELCNIRKMIRFSNFIAGWIATDLVSHENIKSRAASLRHWILTAAKLRELHNFDGLKSILGGLESSSVRRLYKTWEYVPSKVRATFDDLCRLMSEEKSFKTYRAELHSINPPCIPFLGVYLTDLTMIETGNDNQLREHPDLINFHKRHLISQVISELKRYQCIPYYFVRIDEIVEWIEKRPVMDAEHVYQTSLELEPKQGSSGRSTGGFPLARRLSGRFDSR